MSQGFDFKSLGTSADWIEMGQNLEFYGVPIEVFRNAPRDIPFDVFLKLSADNFAHIFSRSTGIDYKRLAQYMQKGVIELFVRNEDRDAFEAYRVSSTRSAFDDPDASVERKVAALLNMTEQNMAELFNRFTVNEETAKSTEVVIKSYVHLMSQDPKSLALLLRLVSHGDYLYYHSIAVAVFSMFVARASGRFDSRGVALVGMGGFLHDIGIAHCAALSGAPTGLVETLDEKSDEFKDHPRLGLAALEGVERIPEDVRFIVYQHHEEPGGGGFPNRLRSNAIFYPAKIVSVVDEFTDLIAHKPHRPAFEPAAAMEILQKERGKYDLEISRLLAMVFSKATKSAA